MSKHPDRSATNKGIEEELKAMGASDLHIAAFFGKIERAKRLIEKGADVKAKDCRGYTPIFLAWCGDSERHDTIIAILQSHGADINERFAPCSDTMLHRAVMCNNVKGAKRLIEKGADVNIKDGTGATALHHALAKNSQPMIELLRGSGATEEEIGAIDHNVPIDSIGGRSILHLVAEHQEVDAILLVNLITNLNLRIKDNKGFTPMWYAACAGHSKLMDSLIKKGIDINEPVDALGRSILHLASMHGNVKAAELLIAKGADVNAKDCGGATPILLAISKDKHEMVSFLKTHMADTSDSAAHSAEGEGSDPVSSVPLVSADDDPFGLSGGVESWNVDVD